LLSFLTVSATFFRLLPQQQMIAIDLFCIWWFSSLIGQDEVGSGYDAPTSTHFESTLTQNKVGAGFKKQKKRGRYHLESNSPTVLFPRCLNMGAVIRDPISQRGTSHNFNLNKRRTTTLLCLKTPSN
jgi:hypothetical protein